MRIKRLLKNIAVLIASFLIILLILELGTRLVYNNFVNDYSMEMWKYSSKLKVKSTNLDLSHVHAPNKEAELYGVNVKINSDGLRDYEYTKGKPDGTYRIAFIGDSVTFGWGVPFNETTPKILEDMLNNNKNKKYEVINFGIGNYNTKQELTLLKEKVLDYNPDMVILGYYINDAEPIPIATHYALKRHSYFYGFLWNKYHLLFGVKNNYKDYYNSLYSEENLAFGVFKNSMQSFIEIIKENNIALIIVINPELHELKDYPFLESNQIVLRIAGKNNILVVDLLPYLKRYNPEELWVSLEDVHPNGVANKIAGEVIYNNMVKDNNYLNA